MRQVTYLLMVLLLLGLWGMADVAQSNSLFPFPDPKAFVGIKGVVVEPIISTNMENVNVNPDTLRETMKNQLAKGGIGVKIEENLQSGDPSVKRSWKDVGVLKASIRRWETSGMMGTTMNSFAISLRFYQKARLQSSKRETWVITWSEVMSVIVGTRRTQGIEDALEELIKLFILDFKKSVETG